MSEVTQILQAAERRDTKAAHELLPLVYNELRRLTAYRVAHDAPRHTLQPTALVHEAWVWLHRVHFAVHLEPRFTGLEHQLYRTGHRQQTEHRHQSHFGPTPVLPANSLTDTNMTDLNRRRTLAARLFAAVLLPVMGAYVWATSHFSPNRCTREDNVVGLRPSSAAAPSAP